MAKRRNEKTKNAAVDLYRSGMPVSAVAKTYRVSTKTILTWSKKYAKPKLEKPIELVASPTGKCHIPKDLARIYDAIFTLKHAGLM